MSTVTVAQNDQTLQFDLTLRQVAARYRATYPQEAARIQRGLEIALAHGVDLLPDGMALIQSQTHPGHVYRVNGRCPCTDEHQAPRGHCKHRYAKSIWKAALAAQKAESGPDRYWATYEAPDGLAVPGIAAWCPDKQCWLFIPEDGSEMLFPAIQALALGGHIATAEAQWADDGDLVTKVCLRHTGARRK